MFKKKSGFSLTEVIVGIGIMSIIGVIIAKLMTDARRNSAISECRGNLRLNTQLVCRALEKDISSSRAILDSNDKNKRKYIMSVKPGSPTGSVVATMICPVFPKDSENESSDDATYFDFNTDKEDNLYEEVTYELQNGELSRKGEKNGSLKIGNNIKSISFAVNEINEIETTYDGKIEITVTAEAKPDGQKEEIQYVEKLIVAIRALQNKVKKGEEDSKFMQRIDNNDD